MNLILFGPPGVGKGTQSELLDLRLGIKPISSGVIFRQEIEAETDLGRLAKRYIDQGRLVPDHVTIEMMAKRMRSPDLQRKGFALDGFPRTLPQAEKLDTMLDEMGVEITRVISFEVPDETLVKRLSGRMGCTRCGAIYHRDNKPPKRDWVCDVCNSELFVRSDDQPEAIRSRLQVFHDQTQPIIEYYERTRNVLHIDGRQDPEDVYHQVIGGLGS
ncbi:MAG: adenylate kinase [Chthonomonas sp.]|nr:adenylate kinase [Chthonomonas sp.]